MKEPFCALQEFLNKTDVKYERDVPFSALSYLRLGGVAPLVAHPEEDGELTALIRYCKINEIPFRLLGRMSNVLPPSDTYRGLVIMTGDLSDIRFGEKTVTAGTGRSLPSLARDLIRLGFSDLTELSGIPASVGGAVYMNAGAYNKEISDALVCARVYDAKADRTVDLDSSELGLSYRRSVLMKGEMYLISATFRLTPCDSVLEIFRASELARKRRSSQPLDVPSLGSVFKKCDGVSAAYYIDRAGLKGYSVGGAAVSEKHAGFIVNNGGAVREDYVAVIEHVKRRVHEAFGVELKEEIEYL